MSRHVASPPADAAARAAGDDFDRAAQALQPGQSLRHPRLREAAALLDGSRVGLAAKMLREFLRDHPRDAGALHLLAEAATRQGRNENAEILLAQCVELAPDFTAGRFSYANALLQVNRPEAALAQAEKLLTQEPRNPPFRALNAMALDAVEDYVTSAASWRELTLDYPGRRDFWTRYGHALRALGLREECIAAYRKAVEINPAYGGAYWSLADLKTFRFGDDEIARMEAQLARADLAAEDRTGMHFALGKAYADQALYETSFAHYAKGNAIHRLGLKHDPEVLTAHVARCKALFTAEFFDARAALGCGSTDPIFIVGMARAGSTLIEQILASHSQIEGTRELPDLAALATDLKTETASGADYPRILETLDAADLKRLGERYLDSVRVHRKRDRSFFTDKMGTNFMHIGMIRLILPHAKIVDMRRHPLACGFSNFTQIFPRGQNHAYRLADIGRLYRDYVELTAHFDRVLPGKVHRVFYESLVADPEAEIRRLLDYLGLPFEPACLRFHETDRVVTTASSEQVRSPIYQDALGQWRHYEPWLGPLKAALGSVLDTYPGVPAFD